MLASKSTFFSCFVILIHLFSPRLSLESFPLVQFNSVQKRAFVRCHVAVLVVEAHVRLSVCAVVGICHLAS